MSFSRPSNYPYPRDLKQVKDVEDYMKKLYASLIENDRAGEYLKDRSTDADLKALIVRPEWYGAKGDGVTDDTTAIQAAIDAAENGTMWLAAKTYAHTGLSITKSMS
jgi:polygalacturonase